MTDQHHITPPPELKQQLRKQAPRYCDWVDRELWLIERAAEWGYDQRGEVNEAELQQARDEELEACCEVLGRELICDGKHVARDLRIIRRSKPPSLKEQALEEVSAFEGMGTCNLDIIRRALEALPDD